MQQRWDYLSFLHWPYDPEFVRRIVPSDLDLDLFEGRAWVGLVPFLILEMRAPGLPPVPWVSRFPETNVRTYVKGPDGQRGVWFFSLDADRLLSVAGGRLAYGLPYMWSSMSLTAGPSVEYASERIWPARGAICRVTVRPKDRYAPGDLTHFDHFLTARYQLYARIAGRLCKAHIEHDPWPLGRGDVERLDENLLCAAGLPAPQGAPLVHYSPSIQVKIGRPKRVVP